MPQSLSSVLVHLIFSTKNRVPAITPEIREELHKYMGGILRDIDSTSITIGGTADHIHVLFVLARTRAISSVVEEIKTGTSKWVKGKGSAFRDFYWQGGYGTFSVSKSHQQSVTEYIDTQEAHHRRLSFQDEFHEFCRKYDVPLDERYVWD